MTDIKTPEERSRNMAAIKGRNTKPEQFICHELFMRGYRYRKNVKNIEGHPDLFLRKYNTAVFVHGCFWHRHKGCRYAYTPKSRVDFWEKKFAMNIDRDISVIKKLQDDCVKCLVVWECTIKRMQRDEGFKETIFNGITSFFSSDELYAEF